MSVIKNMTAFWVVVLCILVVASILEELPPSLYLHGRRKGKMYICGLVFPNEFILLYLTVSHPRRQKSWNIELFLLVIKLIKFTFLKKIKLHITHLVYCYCCGVIW
jgi:hypothetical protein